jgi:predicted acyl esterase
LEQHPNYDEFWQARNILPHLKNIKAAVLTVGGWYDTEDLYGPLATYAAIEKQNPGIQN